MTCLPDQTPPLGMVLPAQPTSAAATTTSDEESARLRHRDRRRKVRASVLAILVAAVPVVLVQWNYGLRPLRTAVPSTLFSQFFDIQTKALLDGDLAVPNGSLGFEAFVHDGHEYLYFGMLPAFLRLPVILLTGDELYGRLTAPSMLLAWAIGAVFVAMMVWRVRALIAPDRTLGSAELWLSGGLIAIATGGSAVLYIVALPWVYSEAMIWAWAASVGVLFALLGVLRGPTGGRVLLVALCTLCAVLSRVTAGWACGVAVLAVAAAFFLSRRHRQYRRWGWSMLAAGAIPLAVGVVINYAKFRHPVAIPFEDQVWTTLSARRRAVIEDGGVSGVRFLPSTLVNYLRPDGVRFSPIFPFITLPATPSPQFGPAALEMRYRTASVTATMPLLFVLGVIGALRVFRRGADHGAALVRIPLLGALLIPWGLLLVGYISPRYAVEFLPALVLSSAVGLAVAIDATRRRSRRRRSVALGAFAVLGAVTAASNLAIATSAARVREGGSSLAELVRVQKRVSDVTGHPLDSWIETGVAPPAGSRPDRVFVIGDCDALLVGTADLYEPWVQIEARPLHVEIRWSAGRRRAQRIPLVGFSGSPNVRVELHVDGDGQYRLVAVGATNGFTESAWAPIRPASSIDLDIVASLASETILIDAPEHLYTSIQTLYRPDNLLAYNVVPTPSQPASALTDAAGVEVRYTRPAPSELCRDLLDAAS